jgi:hypothetical protein
LPSQSRAKKNEWPRGDRSGVADDLDPLADQVIVPLLRVADVQREVGLPHPVPGNLDRRLLRFEVEDLEDRPARHPDPADFAPRRHRALHPEERPHAFGRGVGDPTSGHPNTSQ